VRLRRHTLQDALLADPRWPAFQAQLTAAGAAYNVSFSDVDVKNMTDWSVFDWRFHVWDKVMVAGYVPMLLNRSVFEPIARHFPAVRFSNFAHGR